MQSFLTFPTAIHLAHLGTFFAFAIEKAFLFLLGASFFLQEHPLYFEPKERLRRRHLGQLVSIFLFLDVTSLPPPEEKELKDKMDRMSVKISCLILKLSLV